MSILPRSALLSALLMLAGNLPATAQDAALPREPQIGPRPFYLVDKMKDGPLKTQLAQCTGPFRKTDFSIGHRGAAMQFPEHSRESYVAAARMGAGVIVNGRTFTDYFPTAMSRMVVVEPLRLLSLEESYDVDATIDGGGVTGQAGALRMAIARALVEVDPEMRPALKKAGLLTRDARAKESKKYGLKKARKAPQYTKR